MTGQKCEAENVGRPMVEFKFPILTVKTQLFTGVFDKLGSLRASRLVSWAALVIVPVVTGIRLTNKINSFLALLWNPAAGYTVAFPPNCTMHYRSPDLIWVNDSSHFKLGFRR